MTADEHLSPQASRRISARYLAKLARPSALESVSSGGPEAAARTSAALMDPGVRQGHLDRLERAFARADRSEGPPDPGLEGTRRAMFRDADAALLKLGRNRTAAKLHSGDRTALEAVVRLTGRPSILIKNGDLDLDPADPDLGPWQGAIVLAREGMKQTIRSVGRIDRDGVHIGTGFVVAPGVVMTNRHVLQELGHLPGKSKKWELVGGTPTIDFVTEYGSTRSSSFTITGVLFAGPATIADALDVTKLDLALLSVESKNDAGAALPKPLPLSSNLAGAKGAGELYMVGYPARPQYVPVDDHQLVDTLSRVFRMRYGVKRLALGAIVHPLGEVKDDQVPWAIGHDATTLGGNSGSCVVGLADEGPVLGLHFGGFTYEQNLAHVLAAIPALQTAPGGVAFEWR